VFDLGDCCSINFNIVDPEACQMAELASPPSTNIVDEEKLEESKLEMQHAEEAQGTSDLSDDEDHEHEPPVCNTIRYLQLFLYYAPTTVTMTAISARVDTQGF
jgi:hypothetical protein